MVEKILHKIQLSLDPGPQGPLTFSSPEQPAGEICLLALGMSVQTCFVPKCWSSWKWLTVSSHSVLFLLTCFSSGQLCLREFTTSSGTSPSPFESLDELPIMVTALVWVSPEVTETRAQVREA